MNNLITEVEIKKLWNIYNMDWHDVNRDVNIVVGINGSGKSTILNAMYECLTNCDNVTTKYYLESMKLSFGEHYVDTKTGISDGFNLPLAAQLDRETDTFASISSKMKNLLTCGEDISGDLRKFADIINRLFKSTKKIFDETDFSEIKFIDVKNKTVGLKSLSLGEKQMLAFLYKVFLTRKKEYILFMDEPEYSLHIEWQEQLIDIIRELNPNCQLFLTTHSPNIFSNGWQDKLQFIEDFTTEI